MAQLPQEAPQEPGTVAEAGTPQHGVAGQALLWLLLSLKSHQYGLSKADITPEPRGGSDPQGQLSCPSHPASGICSSRVGTLLPKAGTVMAGARARPGGTKALAGLSCPSSYSVPPPRPRLPRLSGRGLCVAPVLSEVSPLQVFLSGCSMKPTGQLQCTPVAASWHLLSQPPLLTAQVSVEGGVGGHGVTGLGEHQTRVAGATSQGLH